MAFWIASSDSSGNKITISEEQLIVGPVDVDYPTTPAGRTIETSGGSVIQQFPAKDPRRRTWIWQNLPSLPTTRYIQLIHRLETLTAVNRRARGLSPWVWFRDTDTDEFRILHLTQGTATGVTGTTLTDSTKSWAVNALQHGTIDILPGQTGAGQRRTIISNTATSVTVEPAWTTNPTTAQYSIQWSEPTWIRVRVLNVSKTPMAAGGVRYRDVRVEFVIDDAQWTGAGYRVDP